MDIFWSLTTHNKLLQIKMLKEVCDLDGKGHISSAFSRRPGQVRQEISALVTCFGNQINTQKNSVLHLPSPLAVQQVMTTMQCIPEWKGLQSL